MSMTEFAADNLLGMNYTKLWTVSTGALRHSSSTAGCSIPSSLESHLKKFSGVEVRALGWLVN